MKGIELARGYFEEYGLPMLKKDFPDLLPLLAAGFVGSGSERYGFDDEISRDHDFEPGFCIFLPGEDAVSRRQAFVLERAYAKLPGEYGGVYRQPVAPVGGSRNGVLRTAEFYTRAVGAPNGDLTLGQWLHLPDHALAEAVNGEVYFDNYGEFTAIRERLLQMPEDVKRKRLAGELLIMAQAGQYNFMRCLSHGEPEAAQLACAEFVKAAMKVTFLLQNRYMPYYKWSFRALRQLVGTAELAGNLSFLLAGNNAAPDTAEQKYLVIERICADVIALLRENALTDAVCGDLEKHAYSVNDKITDGYIRNLHILAAVKE